MSKGILPMLDIQQTTVKPRSVPPIMANPEYAAQFEEGYAGDMSVFGGPVTTLDKVIDSPAIFKQYPSLANIKVLEAQIDPNREMPVLMQDGMTGALLVRPNADPKELQQEIIEALPYLIKYETPDTEAGRVIRRSR